MKQKLKDQININFNDIVADCLNSEAKIDSKNGYICYRVDFDKAKFQKKIDIMARKLLQENDNKPLHKKPSLIQ